MFMSVEALAIRASQFDEFEYRINNIVSDTERILSDAIENSRDCRDLYDSFEGKYKEMLEECACFFKEAGRFYRQQADLNTEFVYGMPEVNPPRFID